MSEMSEVLAGSIEEWVTALPGYQGTMINSLLAEGLDPEEAARRWLTAAADNTFPFGGEKKDRGAFYDKLVEEVEAYVCGDPKYETEREGLFGEKGLARTYVVSTVAVGIAPALGVSATFLAPAVALVLASIAKITLNAWCSSRRARKGD